MRLVLARSVRFSRTPCNRWASESTGVAKGLRALPGPMNPEEEPIVLATKMSQRRLHRPLDRTLSPHQVLHSPRLLQAAMSTLAHSEVPLQIM